MAKNEIIKKYSFLIIITAVIILCNLFPIHTINSVEAQEISSAKGMCVLEQETGKVFYSKNMDLQLANASTTKIVTAITVIENCKNLDEIITVNDVSIGIEGTSIYLRKG